MKDLLDFIAEHPVLTIILLVLIVQGVCALGGKP